MPSASTRVLVALLRAQGRREPWTSAERVRADVAARALRAEPFTPPRRLERAVRLSVDRQHGWLCYRAAPQRDAARARVLFLHGGAFVAEIQGLHWSLIRQLVRGYGAEVTIPIYPLAPGATAAATVPAAAAIVADYLERTGPQVTLMGDSAGGGLTLAVAQRLRDAGRGPARLVLISPWLDVTLDDPAIAAIEPRDPMLAVPGLREAGRLWAGALDPADPLASPLNGEMAGLPPVTVFTGTRDLLSVDAHRLRQRAHAAGVTVVLHEAPGSPHVYPLWPTTEGRAARRVIGRLLPGA